MSLNLETANKIVTNALRLAREENMKSLTVAVLDAGGHLVAFQREDNSGILRAEIATGKAWGALGMGSSSRTIGERLKNRPTFQNAIAVASQGRLIPVPGGVLICDGSNQIIGAIGISGDTSEKDEYCAIAGVKAAGLIPNPIDPDPNWNAV